MSNHSSNFRLISTLDQIEAHSCGFKSIYGEPQPLQLGFLVQCEYCSKSWLLTVLMIKVAMNGLNLDEKDSLMKRVKNITDKRKENLIELKPSTFGELSIDDLFKKILLGEM